MNEKIGEVDLKSKEINKITTYLKSYKKKTIELYNLESIVSGDTEYKEFAEIILDLEQQGVLKRIKAAKTNNKLIPLGLKYTINKGPLMNQYHERLQKKQFELHSAIRLDTYFKLDPVMYEKDLPFIIKINNYITEKGLPKMKYIPELSFELVNDEKWIDEKNGKGLLKRIGLWEKLELNDRIDPVAFAINPLRFNDKVNRHLIIENKTPFLHVMETLEKSKYATVIYGQGWKITSSIKLFEKQLGTEKKNQYYYFGDLDAEGLSIFDTLSRIIDVVPADEFYISLFQKQSYKGKMGQRYNQEAIRNFSAYFKSQTYTDLIENNIKSHHYQPQELLSKEEIVQILKNELGSVL